jgi:hypothetical protein
VRDLRWALAHYVEDADADGNLIRFGSPFPGRS